MPTVKLYRMDGTEAGTRELPDRIFGLSVDPQLIEQAVVVQRANARTAVAHTQTRAEVRGGGKKPWRQKGTGRARHGSIRSPIWKGGGVAHGPRPDRNFALKMNQKARQKALFMVLSDKVAANRLVLLEKLELAEPKTKAMATMLRQLPIERSVLLVLPRRTPAIERSSRNIPGVTTMLGHSLNVVDVLRHGTLVLPTDAVDVIAATFRSSTLREHEHGIP